MIIPAPLYVTTPPACAVVVVKLMIAPVVYTNGMVTISEVGVDFLQPDMMINVDRKKKRMELFLRKEGIFMEFNEMKE